MSVRKVTGVYPPEYLNYNKPFKIKGHLSAWADADVEEIVKGIVDEAVERASEEVIEKIVEEKVDERVDVRVDERIDELDVAPIIAPEGQLVESVSQENGMVSVTYTENYNLPTFDIGMLDESGILKLNNKFVIGDKEEENGDEETGV